MVGEMDEGDKERESEKSYGHGHGDGYVLVKVSIGERNRPEARDNSQGRALTFRSRLSCAHLCLAGRLERWRRMTLTQRRASASIGTSARPFARR